MMQFVAQQSWTETAWNRCNPKNYREMQETAHQMRVDNLVTTTSAKASKQAVWLLCEWNSGRKHSICMWMFVVFCQTFALLTLSLRVGAIRLEVFHSFLQHIQLGLIIYHELNGKLKSTKEKEKRLFQYNFFPVTFSQDSAVVLTIVWRFITYQTKDGQKVWTWTNWRKSRRHFIVFHKTSLIRSISFLSFKLICKPKNCKVLLRF